tara:strand:+ start:210 stop:1217 length:1008 start_codon:yes stop_codon:yes gene_type:complete
MKITIARLRSGTNYKEPLNDIMDSFYELYKKYQIQRPQYQYGYYNFGFGQANRQTFDDIKNSDVILVPSENEFTFHIKNFQDNRQVNRSNEKLRTIGPMLKDKHLIIMRSDRADNEELYRNKTFKGYDIGKVSILDEMDIEGGIHAMKYYFITDAIPPKLEDGGRVYDFIYWGTDKRKTANNEDSGDIRHTFFKQIYKEKKLKAYWIGKFSGVQRDMKIHKMKDLLPHLTNGKTTMCFNWMSDTATTSRYHEALACGIIPFVHDKYDINNTLTATEWQRVPDVEALYHRIDEMRHNDTWQEKYNEILDDYKRRVLKSKDWYYNVFQSRLDFLVNL